MEYIEVEVTAPRNRKERRQLNQLQKQGVRVMNTNTTEAPAAARTATPEVIVSEPAPTTITLTLAEYEAIKDYKSSLDVLMHANNHKPQVAVYDAPTPNPLAPRVGKVLGAPVRGLAFGLGFVARTAVRAGAGVLHGVQHVTAPVAESAKKGYGK